MRDLYRPVHDILQEVVSQHPEALQPLLDLAAIDHFDLFVTTTPDDLLARALNQARFAGVPRTVELEYAPNFPDTRTADIPVGHFDPKYAAVFYLFGKADVSPFFAIHDEDALEFPYALQSGKGPERMFSAMRTRSLLLIGCMFADWLSRFFVRLSNTERLSSDQRTKGEYLVGEDAVRDHDFVVFLERFSQDSRFYPSDMPIDALAFIRELKKRWLVRNPRRDLLAEKPELGILAESGTIFISYAKEDIDAARLVARDLQQICGDVVWFDKNALTPGVDWERHLRGAIQKCGLFLPLLSATTETRTEGYFRFEWLTAAERSRMIDGRRFIVPIVIDEAYDEDTTRYRLIPDRFTTVQFSHAPKGRIDDRLRTVIREAIRDFRRGRSA
jgi:hypothetical protein